MSTQCIPLGDTTNHPIDSPPSPQATSPAILDGYSDKPRQLRHKISYRILTQNKDSSESVPSIHSSLYDASKRSSTEEETRVNDTLPAESEAEDGIGVDEKLWNHNQSSTKPSICSRAIRSHWQYGSPLETIVEQRSCPSLRTTRSLEMDSGHLQEGYIATARKKKSFSFNDLHEIGSVQKLPSPQRESKPFFEVVVYTDPNIPNYKPPERQPTPPGLPSWTSSQAAYARGRGPTSTRQKPPWRRRAHSTLRTTLFRPRFMPNTSSQRRVPRFRPPPSGHGTDRGLQTHPFHQDLFPKVITSTTSSHQVPAVPVETRSSQLPQVHFLNITSSRNTTTAVPPANPTPPIRCPHTRCSQQDNIPLLFLTNSRIQPSADTQAVIEHLDTDHVRNGRCWKCIWDRIKETFCLLCCGYDDDNNENNATEPEVDFATRFAGGRRIDRGGGYDAGI